MLTDDQKRAIATEAAELLEGGATQAAAATKVGIAPMTLRQWLDKFDLPSSFRSTNGHSPVVSNGLPTKPRPTKMRARSLIPTTYACPHCGGPISAEG